MRIASSQRMLAGRGGLDLSTARTTAQAMLDFMVQRQATVLAFEKMFLLSGIVFLAILPLVFFLRTPDDQSKRAEKIDVHVEL